MTNRAKDKLSRGKPITVLNPDFLTPRLIEFLGRFGLDAVFYDCELGPWDVETIDELRRAAQIAGITSIVRPASDEPEVVARYVNLGVGGVMVPRVNTAEAARRLVETISYARWRELDDFLTVAMIESIEAVNNLDQILQVDGIDVFFLGPGDLSNSLGKKRGEVWTPETLGIVDRALAQIIAAGKIAGTTVQIADTPTVRDKGVLYIYHHLRTLLGPAIEQFVNDVGG
jgi:4-hydroxy-2-oxoheptanedioate aldolase